LKRLDKVKGAEQSWDAQMASWKTVATSLADEFMVGDARVMPTKKACDYCDLSSLCRINEQTTVETAQ
jgi:ATP-dependent helicase/DNAse subunit B